MHMKQKYRYDEIFEGSMYMLQNMVKLHTHTPKKVTRTLKSNIINGHKKEICINNKKINEKKQVQIYTLRHKFSQ